MPSITPPLPGTEWPVVYVDGECSVFDGLDSGDPFQSRMEAMAVELLWNWTRRMYGVRIVTAYPTNEEVPYLPSTFWGLGPWRMYPGWPGAAGWVPVLLGGEWYNVKQWGMVDGWESGKIVRLPGAVDQIIEVVIDGATVDPSIYYLRGDLLIRTDGHDWPRHQRLDEQPGGPGTWSVTYTQGVPVPMGGQIAAGKLACELGKAMQGSDDCGLPSRVQSVARQGVSMEVVQTTFQDVQDGRTGIWLIDSWVGASTAPRPFAAIRSPDRPSRAGYSAYGPWNPQ